MHLLKLYSPVAVIFVVLAMFATAPVHAATPVAQVLGDPAWVGAMGGVQEDDGYGLAVDGGGNAISVGGFQGSADFDPGPGSRILNSVGSVDAFVVKLGSDGVLRWAVSVGGTKATIARDVAVDADGHIYVIGSFEGETDFDPGPGQRHISSNGSSDIFLLRLDGNGNLVSIKTFGSDESDDGQAVAVDRRGHIYITGNFEESMGVGIDPNGGNIVLESEGEDDVFVIRLRNDGELLRAWTLSGDDDAIGRDIAVDDTGNVFVAGEFEGKLDLDPDLDDIRRSAGDEDIFVAKYDDTADQKWGATFGGLEEDERPSISLDTRGNVYMTGNFESTADFDPGPGVFTLTSHGEEDIFLLKLDSSGALAWANAIGGLDADRGEGIVTGHYGDLFITGSFKASVDFDPGAGQTVLNSAGKKDIFIGRYATNGFFHDAQAMSGAQEDIGHAIALDAANGLYVAGSFQDSVDFNVGAAAQERTSAGDSDVFVVKRAYSVTPFGPVSAFLPFVNAGSSP